MILNVLKHLKDELMNPNTLTLFYEPKDRLRLTVSDEKSYITVKPVWAAPLSRPNTYLALLDGKGDEITTLSDPNSLPPESLKAVQEELRRRYLTATVTRILTAKVEYGATYWRVETDRGERDFVTQSLQENAIWLPTDTSSCSTWRAIASKSPMSPRWTHLPETHSRDPLGVGVSGIGFLES